ncbi:hypothetical protein [Ponticoccus alexandrii]|uniref:Uncharacterized protein n=1 Tax=Ponticoccus alexandrii TaxID=1943633 RepID=A0ABX7FA91_9RHOB|nr:hypothetical protein [Ponticoccus alexandrii]ETA51013.1 hypothetical protein P279_16425 [Rhodobacteraceae bacterium PD-2]QRF67046.1 hypothetical protein GQA70_12410 [Ponticoccus alexandrii]
MTVRIGILAAAMALCGTAGLAGFDTLTQCSGTMRFYNEDGTHETYALRFEFEGPRYRIQATSESGEIEPTDDRGQCADYLDAGCRHAFATDSEDHYDFSLSPRGDGKYLYSETWADGFSGNALIDCAEAGAAPSN